MTFFKELLFLFIGVIIGILTKDYVPLKLKSFFDKESEERKELKKCAHNLNEFRNKSLYEKRLKACEELWCEVKRLSPLKSLANYMASLKENELFKKCEDENIKLFITEIGAINNLEELKKTKPALELSLTRIYITDKLYALSIAHGVICTRVFQHYISLEMGRDFREFNNDEKVFELIKSALNKKYGNFKKIEYYLIPDIIEELEKEILFEIKNIHLGINEDEESIKRSKDIIEKAEKIGSDG